MNTKVRKLNGRATSDIAVGVPKEMVSTPVLPTAAIRIPGRPVMDPMNHLDAEAESLAETGTLNPYFGESDPGRLPHQPVLHVAKTRRWIVVSSIVWVVSVLLSIVLIPASELMAAGTIAIATLLYGLAWIFRMFLEQDARRTMLLASIAGLQMLLVIGVGVLVLFG